MGTFSVTIGDKFSFNIGGECLDYVDMQTIKSGYYRANKKVAFALKAYAEREGITDMESVWRSTVVRLLELRKPRSTSQNYAVLGYLAVPRLSVPSYYHYSNRKQLLYPTNEPYYVYWDWGFDREESEWETIVLPKEDRCDEWWRIYKERMQELRIQSWFESVKNFRNYLKYMETFFKSSYMNSHYGDCPANLLCKDNLKGNKPILLDGRWGLILPHSEGTEYLFYPLDAYKNERKNCGSFFDRREGYLFAPILDDESYYPQFRYWLSGAGSKADPLRPMWLTGEGGCEHFWGVIGDDLQSVPPENGFISTFDYNFSYTIKEENYGNI